MMTVPLRVLYCNCTYANVVPKATKEEVLRRLSESGLTAMRRRRRTTLRILRARRRALELRASMRPILFVLARAWASRLVSEWSGRATPLLEARREPETSE